MTQANKKINDWPVLITGNVLLGMLLPTICSIIDVKKATKSELFFTCMIFAAISFILWKGNAVLHSILHNSLYKIKNIYLRLLSGYIITLAYTWLASGLLIGLWNRFLNPQEIEFRTLIIAQWVMIALTIFINNVYQIVYLNKERESDLVRIERTEKLKVQAQLDALKSQIDPHFIFNSLNTLSYLINHDQVKAKLFNDTLAKVYRYILINKESDLVLLKEEIEFASNYFYLLKIRYQQGLSMTIEMESVITEEYFSPPLCLQLLIENAIKHNHFSESSALNINIKITERMIVISNNISQKKFEIPSSKIGLYNLGERYKLITNKSITVEQADGFFTVKLPVLKS